MNGAKNWGRFQKSYNGRDYAGRIIDKPLNGIYAFLTDGFVDSYDDLNCIIMRLVWDIMFVKNEVFKNYMIRRDKLCE